MTKMKLKKGVKIKLVVVLVALVIVTAFCVYTFVYPEMQLRNEVKNIVNSKNTTDEDYKLKSSGKYKEVEEAAKDYLKKYKEAQDSVNNIIGSEYFTGLVSYENISNVPNYPSAIGYIADLKRQFNDQIDELLVIASEGEVMKVATNHSLNSKQLDMYKDIMTDAGVLKDINKTIEYYVSYKQLVNEKFDACTSIYELLILNTNKLQFQDGQIQFYNEELAAQYNEYLKVVES